MARVKMPRERPPASAGRDRQRQGLLRVAAAAVLWGTLGPTFKGLIEEGARPLHIAFWRALLAGAVLMLWLAARHPKMLRLNRRDLPLFVPYGLISVAIYFVLYPLAVQLSTVVVAAVLLYTAPAWVALMATLFLGEPLTIRKIVAIGVTFIGSALVARAYDVTALQANVWGVLAGLASGLTYATLGIFGKVALRRYSPTTVITYALIFGTLFLLPVILRDWEPFVAPLRTTNGVLLLLYIGLVPTTGGMILYTSGLQQLDDAGKASVIATIEPLVAALLGYLLFRETLEPLQWVGGVLILAGVVILQHKG